MQASLHSSLREGLPSPRSAHGSLTRSRTLGRSAPPTVPSCRSWMGDGMDFPRSLAFLTADPGRLPRTPNKPLHILDQEARSLRQGLPGGTRIAFGHFAHGLGTNAKASGGPRTRPNIKFPPWAGRLTRNRCSTFRPPGTLTKLLYSTYRRLSRPRPDLENLQTPKPSSTKRSENPAGSSPQRQGGELAG